MNTDQSLPREPIDRIIGPFERFMHVEASGGIVLLVAAAAALFLANSPWAEAFLGFWSTDVTFAVADFRMQHSLQHWINDGLMALFFFVIGLEIKRELVVGELRDPRNAVLPIVCAVGGMIVPAGVFLALIHEGPGQQGWGIPMATDIAFVVGTLALLGRRIPSGLRVMLLSLAIVDDLGAILVIAFGYTKELHFDWLVAGFGGIVAISLAARLGIRNRVVYVLVGTLVWLCFHESGIHATLAGVILGLQTPARSYLGPGFLSDQLQHVRDVFHGESDVNASAVHKMQRVARETVSPVVYLEKVMHPWVSFAILPLFALANAGVPITLEAFGGDTAVAVAIGLLVGKPLGITLFALIAVGLRLGKLPAGVTWPMVVGGGFLCGIGFTMALFIAGLALSGDALDSAKIGILGGSIVAAITGAVILAFSRPKVDSTEV